jgi:hypothetical protein
MEKIDTLSTIAGRKLLQKIYYELRFERQISGFRTLIMCFRLCTFERELSKYTKSGFTLLHPLGFWAGTSLWMEEIVNRFYYSTINSFVYLGAALILLLVGVRKYSTIISDDLVISGIVFESLMLVFMFILMLFSPNEDINNDNVYEESAEKELLNEIGEIGRDFAMVVVQLESISSSLKALNDRQFELINRIDQIAKYQADASSPNPEMLSIMKETNTSLLGFKDSINDLNDAALKIKTEEIKLELRKELDKVFVNKLTNNE